MKMKLLALLLLAGGSLFAGTRVFFGFGAGGCGYRYYPPPVAVYAPPCPGPGYTWITGYWYPVGPRYYWRAGYWAPPVYGRYWSGPRYYGRGYYVRGYRGYDYYGRGYRGHAHGRR